MEIPVVRLVSLGTYAVVIVWSIAAALKSRREIILLFLLWTLSMALRTGVELGYHLSRTYDQAVAWWHLDFFWTFSLGLWLHFIIVYTNMLRGKTATPVETTLIAAAYASVAAFLAIELLTDWITAPPVRDVIGFRHQVNTHSAAAPVVFIWIIAFSLFSLWRIIQALILADRKEIETRVRLGVVAAVMAVSFVCEIILPLVGFENVEILNILSAIIAVTLALGFRMSRARFSSAGLS
jgi:hypothetical protein